MTQRIDVQGNDELAELGRTFNLMLDRLELAFATQRGFIRDAGHELRTPIAIVRGHLELMAEEDERRSRTRARRYEMLAGELDRMTRFVNDMLLLAKAERPDFLQLETSSSGALCDETLLKSRALGEREWTIDSRADRDDRRRRPAADAGARSTSPSNAVANSVPGRARSRSAAGRPAPRRRSGSRTRGAGSTPPSRTRDSRAVPPRARRALRGQRPRPADRCGDRGRPWRAGRDRQRTRARHHGDLEAARRGTQQSTESEEDR